MNMFYLCHFFLMSAPQNPLFVAFQFFLEVAITFEFRSIRTCILGQTGVLDYMGIPLAARFPQNPFDVLNLMLYRYFDRLRMTVVY